VSLIQRIKGALFTGLPTALSETHDLHPKGVYFNASSCGMCYLRAIRDVLVDAGILVDTRKGQDHKSRRILSLGTMLHNVFEDAVDIGLWDAGGEVMRIAPTRMELTLRNVVVKGTPDGIFLYAPVSPLDNPTLMIVDFKTASGYPFKKAKKEGAQQHHIMQVGTYLLMAQKTPVLKFIIESGAVKAGAIDYVSKEDLDQSMHSVDAASAMASAKAWWEHLGEIVGERLAGVVFDLAVDPDIEEEVERIESLALRPHEKWVCRYCPWGDSDGNCNAVRSVNGKTYGGS